MWFSGLATTTQSTRAAGSFTACGLRIRSVVTLSTCTITIPPEFLAAWAMERFSSVSASRSIVTFPSSSAVVPRSRAMFMGKDL
jgi:hypothetical protein